MSSKLIKMKDRILRNINRIVPKLERSMYVSLMPSTLSSKVDILNNSASNLCHLIYEYCQINHQKMTTIFFEYSDPDRLHEYRRFAMRVRVNNINLRFILTDNAYKGWRRRYTRMINILKQFSTLIWLCETGDCCFLGKLKCQQIVCFNYFISCKSDLVVGENYRWGGVDGLVTTSLLHGQIISSATGVKLDKCVPIGFPRNDTLFYNNKKKVVYHWIASKIGYLPKHIIVFAPTARDYDNKKKKIKLLLGYEMYGFDRYLQDNEIAFIYKLHYYHSEYNLVPMKGVIQFEESYDFTLYDILAFADCVITDYSSIGYDFIITGKPTIYNLYDYDKYVKDRGLSYEPYEYFCPGEIVTTSSEMYKALNNVLNKTDKYEGKRSQICRILHKYNDNKATERAVDYLESLLN